MKIRGEGIPKEKIWKYNELLYEFVKYGYSKDNLLSQNELSLFLDMKSPQNKFDRILLQKLFKFLNLTEFSVITVSNFVDRLFFFKEELKKIEKELNDEYKKEQKNINNIINMCEKYKNEKLNEEGFSENAKLIGEIIVTNFNFNLQGIKEIIVKIIYGKQEKEIIQRINEDDLNINKNFEFKAFSNKDNLKFILLTKNDSNEITEIGSKIYSSEDIIDQESILIQIDIPSIENEDNYIAIIKAKISLRKSEYKYYESLKAKEESKLNKLIIDLEQAENNIKRIDYIYLDNKKKEINKCNRKKVNNDIKRLSKETFEFSKNKYIIEFNNERIINNAEKDFQVNLKK